MYHEKTTRTVMDRSFPVRIRNDPAVCGFWVVPTGQIDNSVLVAYGEVSTFAGALFGVDYRYKCKYKKYIQGEDETENKEEKKDE